jgi:nucleotide-binding universal stress UspA family protein
MKRTQVLVPMDGSEFSLLILHYIKLLLAPTTNQLILLRVTEAPVPLPIEGATLDDVEIYQQQAKARVVAEITAELQHHTQPLTAAGFAVAIEVRFGDPLTEIERFLASANIELVAMTTHGRSGLRSVLLGSVAQHLLRHAGVPLLLYRPFGYV